MTQTPDPNPLQIAWNILTLDPQAPIIGLVAAFKHEDHIALRVKNGLQASLKYQDPPPAAAPLEQEQAQEQHPGLLVASCCPAAHSSFGLGEMTILLLRISILAFLAYLCSLTTAPSEQPLLNDAPQWVVAQAGQQFDWLQVNPHVHLLRKWMPNTVLPNSQIKLAWNKKTSAWMTHRIATPALQPANLTPWPKRFLAPPPNATTDQARTWVEVQVLLLRMQSSSSKTSPPYGYADHIWLASWP